MPTPDRPYGEDLLDVPQHESLASIAHAQTLDSYQEKTVDGDDLFATYTHWTNSGKTVKIREMSVTRNANKVVIEVVIKQYVFGVLDKTRTTTITRDGSDNITSQATVTT